jgi:HicB family
VNHGEASQIDEEFIDDENLLIEAARYAFAGGVGRNNFMSQAKRAWDQADAEDQGRGGERGGTIYVRAPPGLKRRVEAAAAAAGMSLNAYVLAALEARLCVYADVTLGREQEKAVPA